MRTVRALIPAARRTGRLILGLLFGMSAALPVTQAENCRPAAPAEAAADAGKRFDQGLLWKIETRGAPPSYLFGTFHSNDPRITRLPCPVERVFDGTGSYTMEVIMNGAGMVTMAKSMFFSDGNTLRKVLGEPLYRDTVRAAGLDPDTNPGSLDNMKPWAVMMMLLGPREGSGLFLDMALQFRATRQGKSTYGLESMDEQIAVFNDLSLEDQVVLLKDAVQNARLSTAVMEELTQAYLKRDLVALQALQDKYKPADTRVQDEMNRRLLVRRNHLMAERLQPRLREGNAFIAVGALHLPGNDGLLHLLSKAGYRVTVVY